MPTVRLTGWRYGLEKVELTKLIREKAGLALAPAKNCTNELLAGRPVSVVLPSLAIAREFLAMAERLGAEGVIQDETEPRVDD
jgi:hypothetical protein